jgi:predicted nucleotidyltransferase
MVGDREIKKIITEVVEKIRREYEPEKIILFGSYAYGNPTADSDIDLFIVKETGKRRIDRFVEVKRLIYEPDREVSISPLVYTPEEVKKRVEMGDDFVAEVLSRGEVLYAG